MQHGFNAPVALTTLFVAASLSSAAFAADPTGIWAKDDGSAKLEVTKCGRGLCSKIVWLATPTDARGKPLRDARNEDASLRDRPIMGLSLFSRMAPAGPNAWVGNVYNPEEGRLYSDVQVTLVSSRQIVLRGCRAMLFCGEKTWTRTQLPPSAMPPAEAPVEIEAKASPAPHEPAMASAASIPSVEPQTYIAPGVVAISTKAEPLPLSGEDVPSMMVMNKPTLETVSPASPGKTPAVEAAATDATPPLPPRKQVKPQAKPEVAMEKPEAPARVATRAPMTDTAVPAETKPKPKVRQVVEEPQERLPWQH